MIVVSTVQNNTKNSDKKYCFSSVADTEAGTEEIIERMCGYNSTLTKADASAAIAVLDDVVKSLLSEGCKVKLPWISLQLAAKGTADDKHSLFSPGNGDNTFVLRAAADREFEKSVLKDVSFKSSARGLACEPKIITLCSLDSNAEECESLAIPRGRTLRIRGRHLLFSTKDSAEGVFFVPVEKTAENGAAKYRADEFMRLSDRIIDAAIPETLPAGKYKVEIVTKKKSTGLLSATAQDIFEAV